MSRMLCILALMFIALDIAHGQTVPAKAVAVPRATSRIVVDGKLAEPAWKSAAVITTFVPYGKTTALRNQTEVRLTFDDKALYIAFQCSEKDMDRLKASVKEHDSSVWNDDAVEVFLDTKGDRSGFVQFVSNVLGTRYDGLGNDSYGYNPTWESAASRGKTDWTVEIRLPFNELGVPAPKPGDAWLGNFCREEQPYGELSTWAPTAGAFGATAHFGEIIFGRYTDKLARDLSTQSVAIAGLEKHARKLHLDVSELLVDAKTRLRTAVPLSAPSILLTEGRYLKLQELLNRDRVSLAKASDTIRRAEMGNPDYLVWETSPWKHFAMNEDISRVSADTKSVDAVVLAGQTESKALMVSNLTDETLSARLILSGFPEDSVEVLIPTFVRSGDGTAFPDALVPLDAAGQIVVPAGETRQVYINIKGAKPGRIEGMLTISPLTASKTDKVVKVTGEVIQPRKPVANPRTFTWDFLGDAESWGLVNEYMQTMLDHELSVFWISGIRYMPQPKADDEGNLLTPMDWKPFEEQVKLKWRPGRKLYISMDVWEKSSVHPMYNGKFDSPGWRIAFKKVVGEMLGVLKRNGLTYDDYMLNPLDESIDQRYIAIARLIKEVDPKVRIVEDTIGENLEQVKEADKYTDWWIPHFKAYLADSNKASLDFMKSTGKPVGFYFYSEGANEKAQDSYHHYLWDFWYAYSRGLDGIFGYWTATQHYGDAWNRHQTTAAYDPSLFYPGNGCVITGRRWEAWRRGTEDFALLKACESAGVDKRTIQDAVKSVLDAPNDPLAAERARELLTRALK